MTSQRKAEIEEKTYTGIDVEQATAALHRALENRGGVMIYRGGEMVWETGPERIFPEGVEAKVCECGRVMVKDLLNDTDYLGR